MMAGTPGSSGEVAPFVGQGGQGKEEAWTERAEVDTSAPFESVKEAVDHFGGSGHWRVPAHCSSHSQNSHCTDAIPTNVEEQTGQLEKDLIVKEQETLEVLKELETTKRILDGLKLKVQRESSEAIILPDKKADSTKVHPITDIEEHNPGNLNNLDQTIGPKQSPGLILMELKQAKLNLNRTTSDFTGIRSSIEEFKTELEKEKFSMEKTHEKIALNTARISSLEKELSHSRLILQLVKDLGLKKISANPPHISRKFHELRSETEQFKRMEAASESEVLKMIEEVERNKSGIKTLEVRVVAARKVEEAAKATKLFNLAEIKALTNSQKSDMGPRHSSGITMTVEEYNMLVQKAQEAEGVSSKKIEAAMRQVDEANKTKMELSKKVEEANVEIKNSRKALDEALNRVEAANKGKLAVEEALRKWRSEHGQKRRSVHSSPRFKNSCPSHHRRDSKTLDATDLSSPTGASQSVLRSTLSIGQILSRKLLGPEEIETGNSDSIIQRPKVSPKISLGQMLNRKYWSSPENNGDLSAHRNSFHAKKKKLGFVSSFSLILANHARKNKKKKRRQAWSPK